MTAYPHTMVVIVPAALKPASIAMSAAMNWDADPSVPLSPTGTEPATHYGLHTWAGADFVAILTGQVTPPIEGYTAQQVEDFRNAIIVSVDPPTGEEARAHFDLATAAAGLQMIDDHAS
ncbi:MAG: hypothetical protein ROR55_21175 [Devosia sp.]